MAAHQTYQHRRADYTGGVVDQIADFVESATPAEIIDFAYEVFNLGRVFGVVETQNYADEINMAWDLGVKPGDQFFAISNYCSSAYSCPGNFSDCATSEKALAESVAVWLPGQIYQLDDDHLKAISDQLNEPTV